jgi:hypothetical protein
VCGTDVCVCSLVSTHDGSASIAWAAVRGNRFYSQNEANISKLINGCYSDMADLLQLGDDTEIVEAMTVDTLFKSVPDVSIFSKSLGMALARGENKNFPLGKHAPCFALDDIAVQCHRYCDQDSFTGVQHPCCLLSDGEVVLLTWRACDDEHWNNLIGAESETRRDHWPRAFARAMNDQQGKRRLMESTPAKTKATTEHDDVPSPERGHIDLATPAYDTDARGDDESDQDGDADTQLRDESVGGDVIVGTAEQLATDGAKCTMHRTVAYAMANIDVQGRDEKRRDVVTVVHDFSAIDATAIANVIVKAQDVRTRVLKVCSLVELSLASGAERVLPNNVNGKVCNLFAEVYTHGNPTPRFMYWRDVTPNYAPPGQCRNFARLRYLDKGSDGTVSLFSTCPDVGSRCRVFVAKQYRYRVPMPMRNATDADEEKTWRATKLQYELTNAQRECEYAHKIYCTGENPLFPKSMFAVKTIGITPMLCMPYFEAIPANDRSDALQHLRTALARLVRVGLAYSKDDNEWHWRHYLRCKIDGTYKYVLIDFGRLVELGTVALSPDEYVDAHYGELYRRA